MSIVLTSELLGRISLIRKRFENECDKIQKELIELGSMYIQKIEDEEHYEKLILDSDFKGRSMLKIIMENSFYELMPEEDGKGVGLLDNFWYGKEANKCDGKLGDYSSIYHVLTYDPLITTDLVYPKEPYST